MGFAAGAALRGFSTFLYALEFCCAGIVLGVYSYYLARLTSNDLHISADWKAVEGLSGSIVLYTIFAVILTCFLAGFTFFAYLGVFLDVLMMGAFIGIAILTRDGASSCSGHVDTPLGSGPADENSPLYRVQPPNFGFNTNTKDYTPDLSLACRLNTAAFAVAVIGAFLMLISAVFQILISRNHQREKKYGPSPANNYTSGSGRGFWHRKTTRSAYAGGFGTTDAEKSVDGTTNGHTNGVETNGAYTAPAPVLTQDAAAPRPAAPPTDSYVSNVDSHYHRGPTGTAVGQNF